MESFFLCNKKLVKLMYDQLLNNRIIRDLSILVSRIRKRFIRKIKKAVTSRYNREFVELVIFARI